MQPDGSVAPQTGHGTADAALLDEFCDQVWLEDGLAKATLESYRRDLRLFSEWLARRDGDLLSVRETDVLRYLEFRHGGGGTSLRASSQARLHSSLKRFYQFALRGNRIGRDPTLNLDRPKQA
ncbi:MAG: site-specific integrase, partial [Burkholderiales bacterium]